MRGFSSIKKRTTERSLHASFFQLKLSPQSTPNSLIETNVVAVPSATDVIEPKIHTGTFPLGNPIEVALFQGQIITIRID